MDHKFIMKKIMRYIAWITLTISLVHILKHLMISADVTSLDFIDTVFIWFFSAYTSAHLAEIE